MKRFLWIWNFLWFYFAYTAFAYADPISAIIAAVSSVLSAGGIGAAILKTIVGLALSVAGSLLQKAFMKQDKPRPSGTKLEVEMGDDKPMSFIIGKGATAGKRKYIASWGKAGDTPNAYLTDVIELSSIPNRAGAQGLASVWVDETKVTIDYDRPHADGRGYPVTEYRKDGKDYLWIKFKDGTQTTADSFLEAQFGSLDKRPWNNLYIGRGVQYVIVTCRFNRKLFKNGLPRCIFEPKPIPLYDIRKDSTNGGSGSHRWDTPSTWEPSVNNAVMIYNIVRGIYYNGEWIYGGQNLAPHRLPASNWIAAANACDTAISLSGGGTEPQFRGGCEVEVNMEPLEVIDTLRLGCSGRLAEVGGAIKLQVGAPGAAVYSFTDAEILVTESQSFDPFPTLSSIYNGIEGTYPEPGEKWATKNAPPRYDSDLETADGSRRLLAQVDFAATPYGKQVQRLMRTMLKEERRFRTHQFYLPPDAWTLEPNDVLAWTSDRMGYSNKKFIVTLVAGAPTFCQLVTLKELDPTDYDWSDTYEQPEEIGVLDPVEPAPQPMTGWSVEPAAISDSLATPTRPAIKALCGSDLDDVRSVRVQVRNKATLVVVFDSSAIDYETPFQWILSGAWCLPNTEYEVRGLYIPYTRRDTEWSAWLSVTTPNLVETTSVLDGSITAEKLADGAVAHAKLMAGAVETINLADGTVTHEKVGANAITAKNIVVTNFSNILTNPVFDQGTDGLDGWILDGGTDYPTVGDAPLTNPPAVKAVFIPTRTAAFNTLVFSPKGTNQADIPVAPGESYYFEAMVYAPAGTDSSFALNGLFRASPTDSTGQVAFNSAVLTPAGATGWTKIAVNVTVPATLSDGRLPTSMRVTYSNRNNGTAGADKGWWVTRGFFRKRMDGTLIVDGSIVADHIAAATITASKMVIANWVLQPINVLQTGFTTRWTLNGGTYTGTASGGTGVGSFWHWLTSVSPPDGQPPLVMDQGTAAAVQLYVDDISKRDCDGCSGIKYEVSVNSGTGPASATGFYLRFYWYDAAGVAISPSSTTPVSNSDFPTSPAWKTYSGLVQVPANAKQFMVRMYHNTTTTTRYCVVDKLEISTIKKTDLIVDGQITAATIACNSLDAVSATLGAVNISSAVIGTLTVGTSNIAANAVTEVEVSQTSGGTSYSSTTSGTVVNSISLTVGSGESVVLMGTADHSSSVASSLGCDADLQLYRGTTAIGIVRDIGFGSGGTTARSRSDSSMNFFVKDSPSAGTYTYSIKITRANSEGSNVVSKRCLVGMVYKR